MSWVHLFRLMITFKTNVTAIGVNSTVVIVSTTEPTVTLRKCYMCIYGAYYGVICPLPSSFNRDSWSFQSIWQRWKRLYLKAGAGDGHAFTGLHAQWSGVGGYHPKTWHGRYASLECTGWCIQSSASNTVTSLYVCLIHQVMVRLALKNLSHCLALNSLLLECLISFMEQISIPCFGR